jgi:hypothetical protein
MGLQRDVPERARGTLNSTSKRTRVPASIQQLVRLQTQIAARLGPAPRSARPPRLAEVQQGRSKPIMPRAAEASLLGSRRRSPFAHLEIQNPGEKAEADAVCQNDNPVFLEDAVNDPKSDPGGEDGNILKERSPAEPVSQHFLSWGQYEIVAHAAAMMPTIIVKSMSRKPAGGAFVPALRHKCPAGRCERARARRVSESW